MKSNQQLFIYSKNHPEPIIDESYAIIRNHKDLQSFYDSSIIFTNRLKQLKQSNTNSNLIIDDIFNEWGQFISYIPFGGFINACGTNRDTVGRDKDLLKNIIKLYIKNRNIEVPTKSLIQSSIDRGSSRGKGNLGRFKLERILDKAKYERKEDLQDLINANKAYGVCSKNNFNLLQLRSKLNISLNSAKKAQDKELDFVIKHYEKYFILEQKHINVSGGGQDKQIKELIEVISNKEKKNKNVFYISFLDGRYFNDILLGKSPKNMKQVKDIELALAATNNLWLNTYGFKEFLKRLSNA